MSLNCLQILGNTNNIYLLVDLNPNEQMTMHACIHVVRSTNDSRSGSHFMSKKDNRWKLPQQRTNMHTNWFQCNCGLWPL